MSVLRLLFTLTVSTAILCLSESALPSLPPLGFLQLAVQFFAVEGELFRIIVILFVMEEWGFLIVNVREVIATVCCQRFGEHFVRAGCVRSH